MAIESQIKRKELYYSIMDTNKEKIEDQNVYYDPEKIKVLQEKIAELKTTIVVKDDGGKKFSLFGKSKKDQEKNRDPRLVELEKELKEEMFKPRRPKNDMYNAADAPTVDGEHYKGNNDNIKNTIQAHNLAEYGCGCLIALVVALTGGSAPQY